MQTEIKRGEIYFIHVRQTVGSEQRAGRPAVIVSNDKNNENSEVVEVVFMTAQPKTDIPTHFITQSALKPSTVLCEQINSICIERIGAWVGTLTADEIKMLDHCLAISVGISETIQSISQSLINEKYKEVEALRIEAAAAQEAKAAAEQKATTYKEMYDFLLEKRLGA